MSKLEDIKKFVAYKKVALAGVSRNGEKFGNVLYKELRKKGYEVYPVNPHTEILDGEKCYRSLAELPKDTEGILINLPPASSVELLKEANEVGLKSVWLQQGASSEETREYCANNQFHYVDKACILMYAEPVESIHKFHRWVLKLFRRYPD